MAVAVVLIPAVALALAGLPHQWSQRLPDGHDGFVRPGHRRDFGHPVARVMGSCICRSGIVR